MSDDGQDGAEQFDEDLVGGDDPVTSDEVEVEFPPDRPMGLPFADADVTDESVAERADREEPEVWERSTPSTSATDEELEAIPEPEAD